jgi:hypothetical protein
LIDLGSQVAQLALGANFTMDALRHPHYRARQADLSVPAMGSPPADFAPTHIGRLDLNLSQAMIRSRFVERLTLLGAHVGLVHGGTASAPVACAMTSR